MSDSEITPKTGKPLKQPKLDVGTVLNRLWEARVKWYNMGLQLSLTEGDLEAIKSDNSDIDSCFRCMISKWLRQVDPEPTWTKIIEVLMTPSVNFPKLAQQLLKILESGTTVHKDSGPGIQTLADAQSIREKSSILELSGLFPHIDKVEGLDDVERGELEEKLCLESQQIMLKFFALRNKFFRSLEVQQLSLESLVRYLKGLKALKVPTLANPQQPALKDILDKVKNVENVKDIIEEHSSFYDYCFVEYMIDITGTPQDKSELENYTKYFKQYAERRVYFCPSKFVTEASSSKESDCKLYVKLDSVYDEYNLSGIKRFQLKLASLLNTSYEVLRLCSIEKGCFKLTFLIPNFMKDIIFPLSPQQELGLEELNVLQLKCGDYCFTKSSQGDSRRGDVGGDDSDSDDDDDDDDDGDFSRTASVLTGISEHIIAKSSDKDKDSAVGTSLITGSKKEYTHSLVSTNLDLDEPLFDFEFTSHSSHDDYDSLLKAAKNGDLSAVKNLVEEKRFNPEQLGNTGSSALHYAAAGGSLNVLRYFIEDQECSHSLQGNLLQTPLHVAAQYGKFTIVQYLVKGQSVEPYQQDKYHRTAVHYASIGGKVEILKYLINEVEKYMKLIEFINDRTKAGCNLLHLAAYNGHEEIVKYLILKLNCDAAVTGRKGRTALHEASINGHESVVRFLCSEYRCSPTCLDNFKSTPLHVASANGHLSLIKYFLFEACPDMMKRTLDNYTPLHLAALNGHVDIVKFLTSDPLNCNPAILGYKQRNLFHLAAICGHLPLVRYITSEMNFNPFMVDRDGNTPVEIASINHNDHIVSYLHSYYLCDGASKGDLSYMKRYINKFKCDPNTSATDGNTALHCACANGHILMVKYLVNDMKCHTSKRNTARYSPLHLAVVNGHPEIVHFLTSDLIKCDPNQPSVKSKTALHLAAEVGNLDIVTYLTQDLKCDPLNSDKDGCIPMDLAILGGHNDVATFLNCFTTTLVVSLGNFLLFKSYIENHKCDPNPSDKYGDTPLHTAARNGELQTVKYLIEVHNCDPSCFNKEGRTPLHFAAKEGHLNVVEYLAHNPKCDKNILDKFNLSPLCIAIMDDHLSVVKYLIEIMKCKPTFSGPEGQELVHHACSCGSLNTIKYLIKNGYCDPNSTDDGNMTPLYYASMVGHLAIIKYLIEEQKCNPYGKFEGGYDLEDESYEFEDLQQRTPVHAAAYQGHLHILKYLLNQCKCKPSVTDEDGRTPLHLASSHGHFETVVYLIEEQGCDPLCYNFSDETPLYEAASNGHLPVVKYLIKLTEKNIKLDPQLIINYYSGKTPLHAASSSGHLDVVKHLISEEYYSPVDRDNEGSIPLYHAALCGQLEVVKYLGEIAPDTIEMRNEEDSTPLLGATLGGHLQVIRYFIKILNLNFMKHVEYVPGFPVYEEESARELLNLVISIGNLEVLKYMIDVHKCDPLIGLDPLSGTTMLHLAIERGHLDIVKYLIEQKHVKFNNELSMEDEVSLSFAGTQGHFHVVRYLIEEQHCYLSETQITSFLLSAAFRGDKESQMIDFIYKHVETRDSTS